MKLREQINHGNNKIKTDKRAKEEQEESDCADSVSFEGGFGSYQQAFTGNIPSAAFVSEGQKRLKLEVSFIEKTAYKNYR